MMSQVIRQETVVFLTAVLHGALLTFFYDLLRAARRVFAHSTAAVSAEDFLFWIAAGFLTFCLLFQKTNGVIRGYVAVGAALGVAVYLNLFSRFVLWVVTGILRGVRGIFRAVGKAVGKVRRMIGKAVRKVCGTVRKAVGKVCGTVRKAAGKKIGKAGKTSAVSHARKKNARQAAVKRQSKPDEMLRIREKNVKSAGRK